jgi:hypothetical protein
VYPDISGHAIIDILVGGTLLAVIVLAATTALRRVRGGRTATTAATTATTASIVGKAERDAWRTPPLADLPKPVLTLSRRIWMGALRGYLVVAVALVIVKVVQLAIA